MTLLAINDAAYISRMARAIYDRITVAGPEIVGVRLTQVAYAHGSALAPPQRLNWRADRCWARVLATYEIPIEGRADDRLRFPNSDPITRRVLDAR